MKLHRNEFLFFQDELKGYKVRCDKSRCSTADIAYTMFFHKHIHDVVVDLLALFSSHLTFHALNNILLDLPLRNAFLPMTVFRMEMPRTQSRPRLVVHCLWEVHLFAMKPLRIYLLVSSTESDLM